MSQLDLEKLLETYPDVLTVEEVATILRVHVRSVQRWARDGRIASVRIGRSYRFTSTEVLRVMLRANNTH